MGRGRLLATVSRSNNIFIVLNVGGTVGVLPLLGGNFKTVTDDHSFSLMDLLKSGRKTTGRQPCKYTPQQKIF